MNPKLLLLLLLLPGITMAQSTTKNKKALLKENDRLYQDLDVNFRKTIALRDSCAKKVTRLDVQVPFYIHACNEIDSLYDRKVELTEKLALLGFVPEKDTLEIIHQKIQSNTIKTWQYETYKESYTKLLRLNKTFELPSLDGLSRKEQLKELQYGNQMLHSQTNFLSKLQINTIQLLVNLGQLVHDFDTELSLLPLWKQQLTHTCQHLESELEAYRSRFKRNGPKGFDTVYLMLFPDVFPEETARYTKAVTDAVDMPEELLDKNAPPAKGMDALGGNWAISEKSDYQEPLSSHNGKSIVRIPEEPAEFNGNLKAYIKEKLVYPEIMREMAYSGKSYLSFVVNDDGVISDIVVQRGAVDCPDCDKEAIRLIKGMPEWVPGKVGGKPVNSSYNLPVKFDNSQE